MKWRYTVTSLRAGQPRAYADSEYLSRLLFEMQDWRQGADGPFVPLGTIGEGLKKTPEGWPELHIEPNGMIYNRCKHFSGWAELGEGDWASTRLVYIKQVGPGEVEWLTRAAYTD